MHISDKEVVEIMGISDVFAFPTGWEGFGIVVIEAMAIGLPVIASDIYPLNEIIKDGFNGRLVDSSPEEFSKEIINLLEDKKKMSDLSKNAKRFAKRFDWNIIGDDIEKLLITIKEHS
jgi:glycosyltransferase involved in cell wall biosynthesis